MPRRVLGRAAVESDPHRAHQALHALDVVVGVEAARVAHARPRPSASRWASTSSTASASASRLAGRHEPPGDAVAHDLGQAVDMRRDDRRADGHRLGEHRAERLLVGGQHEHVEMAHQARSVLAPGVVLDLGGAEHRSRVRRVGVRRGRRRRSPRSARPVRARGSRAPPGRGRAGPCAARSGRRSRSPARCRSATEPRLAAGRDRPGSRRRSRSSPLEAPRDRCGVGQHDVGASPETRHAIDHVVDVQHDPGARPAEARAAAGRTRRRSDRRRRGRRPAVALAARTRSRGRRCRRPRPPSASSCQA